MYFSQLSGCVLSPCAHILHSITQAGHSCLMVMTVPSVNVLHGSLRSCSEMSIPPKSWLCGCWTQRLSTPGASRVPWCWLCWSQRWACCPMHFSLLLSWSTLDAVKSQLCKMFARRVNVVQLGEIRIVWFWNFFFFFFCLCRALFQVCWFYFSCVSSLCSERAAVFAGLTFRVHQACLFYHLEYDLSFPSISD